jgi:hypothetical protein
MSSSNTILSFLAKFISGSIIFVFNRNSYIILNVLSIAFFEYYYNLWIYIMLGMVLAPFIAFIEFPRQKFKFEKELGEKFFWYHYIPFFVCDVLAWTYMVMGVTGDVIYGHITKDMT